MSRTPQERLVYWRTTAYATWGTVGILVLITAAAWAVGMISSALAPFAVAFILVFFLQGPVRSLERRGLKRHLAVALCFSVFLTVVGTALVFIIPSIGREVVAFASAMPGYLESGQEFTSAFLSRSVESGSWKWISDIWGQVSDSVGAIFMNAGKVVAQRLVSAGSGVATVVFDLFMGSVVAFWILKDLPKIRSEMRVLAGDAYEDDLENLLATVGRVVGGYLKGQTIASLFTGLIVGVGLAIVGVKYALVLGILAFFLNFVPYIGPFIVAVISAVVGLFASPLAAVLAVVVCVAAQQITDLFITPRVMSAQVDLHPVLVIFSLLVGGALFGFWGMIFAIPFAATSKGLFVYYWERRNNRALATEDGALFRSPACEEEQFEAKQEVTNNGSTTDCEQSQGSV